MGNNRVKGFGKGDKGMGFIPRSPEKAALAYRGLGLILLYFIWIREGAGLYSFFLPPVLLALMLVRWRMPALKATLVLDQALIGALSLIYGNNSFGLGLPLFEAFYLGYPLYGIPGILFALIRGEDPGLWLLMGQSAFAGMGLWGWRQQKKEAFRQLVEGRKQYYELENFNRELLALGVKTAKMAELAERNRIARDLHDRGGHEIIAAYMSLQAAHSLMSDNRQQAMELMEEGLRRLEGGVGLMRDTVHNLESTQPPGIITLQKLCDGFTLCPITFSVFGDTSRVPVYHWSILEPCLKEALTNILRHAMPTKVHVALDITPHIVRLMAENDGVKEDKNQSRKNSRESPSGGMGLRSLRLRTEAVGGNLSTDRANGFRLVCVLPLNG